MEIISKVNWVDILSLILLLRISYVSFQGGLSHELFSLLGTFFNLVISIHYYAKIGAFISDIITGFPIELSNFFSFLMLTISFGLLFRLLRAILDKVIKIQWHPVIEAIGGMTAGVAKSCLAISLVLITLILLPLPYMQWSIRDKSLTGMFFLRIGPTVYAKSHKFIPVVARGEPIDVDGFVKEISADKSLGPVRDRARTPREES